MLVSCLFSEHLYWATITIVTIVFTIIPFIWVGKLRHKGVVVPKVTRLMSHREFRI